MKSEIPFGAPIIGEEEERAVLEVLRGPQLVHGPRAKQFESDFAEFSGSARAVSVASCTAGLHLAYMQLGIGPGDEVLVPAQTHVATAHSVEYTGARPVFVDVCPDTGNIDLALAEAAITARTRAIVVVHYLGLMVDMEAVNAIARKHDLFVLEDCALALGARFRGHHAGTLGDAGVFSFYPVKHITTAEGGMLISRNADIASRVEKLKAFGYDKNLGERSTPGLYDVDRLGYNYRMNEIEAAIGIEQLRRAPGFAARRRSNARTLRAGLATIAEIDVLVEGSTDHEHANYAVVAVLDDTHARRRSAIIAAMRAAGVGSSIYYPGPVPHLRYYREKYQLGGVRYPNAERISHQSIALPVGPHLDEDDMVRVANTLKNALAAAK